MFLWTAATNFRMVRLLCNANSYNYVEDSEVVVPRCSVEKAKASNFIKKETLAQVFPVNFWKSLRTPFSTEHLPWLLLKKTNLWKSGFPMKYWQKQLPRSILLKGVLKIFTKFTRTDLCRSLFLITSQE